MTKVIFFNHEIHCHRCGYRGLAKLNKLHLVLFVILAPLAVWSLFAIGFVQQFHTRGAPYYPADLALGTLAVWIGRDERVYLCPKCENVYYERLN